MLKIAFMVANGFRMVPYQIDNRASVLYVNEPFMYFTV